jgi:hypothetical protein
MQNRVGALGRGFAAGALIALAAWGAGAAAVGGGYWPGVGPGRISLRRSGVKPIAILANLRFDFAGAPTDLSGTGTVSAYDAEGQDLLAQFPCTWTTGKGAAFQLDLVNAGFAAFLEERIEAATGKTAVVTLEIAKGRGAIVRQGEDLRATVSVVGEASLDGGESVALRVKLHAR